MMAGRPWITPEDVRSYSDYECVQKRADEKLKVDISRAELYISSYTNRDFSGDGELPDAVRTAAILLAEYYAYGAVARGGDIKSETLDDYSYTLGDASAPTLEAIGLSSLLDPYKQVAAKGTVTLHLHAI